MINVLLMCYDFQSPWAYDTMKTVLRSDMRVTILTMSHGAEIPDGDTWTRLYGPNGEIRKILTDAYGAYGIPEEQISFVSWYHDTAESAGDKLRNSDVVFLTGGLPDLFLERVQKMGLERLLKNYHGVVMGCSAGAMMQMTEYHITPDADYSTYGYFQGLGLLDGFEPEVHYTGSEIQKECMERYRRERGKPIYAIANDGGMLIRENGSITLMGNVEMIF